MNNNTNKKDLGNRLDEIKKQLNEFAQNPNKILGDFEKMKKRTEFTNEVYECIDKEYEKREKAIIKNGIIGVTTGIAIVAVGAVLTRIL